MILEQNIEQWNISNKIAIIVTDNGYNMLKAVRQLNYESFPCFLHSFHLVLTDSIFNNNDYKILIDKFREIAFSFRKSKNLKNMLFDITHLKLINDVITKPSLV